MILYSVIVLLIIWCCPRFAATILGQPTMTAIMPMVVICWVVHHFPLRVPGNVKWGRVISAFRFFSLAFPLLFPFLIWRYTAPRNIYFFINSQLAILSGIGCLFQLHRITLELAYMLEKKAILLGSSFAKGITFYFWLVPFLSIITMYITNSDHSPMVTFDNLYFSFDIMPIWLLLLFLLPVILSVGLLFAIRNALKKKLYADFA